MYEAYSLLGVAYGAPESVVMKAWKRLVRLVHPDKPGGSTERSQLINEAKYTLVDMTSESAKLREWQEEEQVFLQKERMAYWRARQVSSNYIHLIPFGL
jgi:DnaJ domain